MEPFRNRHVHMRMASVEASESLHKDGHCGFHFVYIDGAHDQASVKANLEAWWPLVRPGGIMAGHDFSIPDVSAPVIAFAKRNRLDLMIVNEHGGTDVAEGRPGTGQDRNGGWASPSFVMFKPE